MLTESSNALNFVSSMASGDRKSGISGWLRSLRAKRNRNKMRTDFHADGLGVRGKNLGFMHSDKFARAWETAERLNIEGWKNFPTGVPDIRWRAHLCCWAAQRGRELEGDFVECGVHTGLLSLTIAHYMDFATLNKNFWLFDTYEGIPLAGLSEDQAAKAQSLNEVIYFDVFDFATRNFAEFPNIKLIRGILPGSLAEASFDKIAYLSVDLNNAPAEKDTIEALWDRVTPSAVIVIDDYAFSGHEEQYEVWNTFADSVDREILTMPTGQGLMIK